MIPFAEVSSTEPKNRQPQQTERTTHNSTAYW